MRTLVTLASLVAAGLAPFLMPASALPVAHAPARAAPAQDAPQVQREHVAGSVHVLYGQGGNVAASVGDDGVLLVDSQFPYMVDGLLASVGELTDAAPRFLINTHWHGDHVGGNQRLGTGGAVIVAHDNVRARMSRDHEMSADGRDTPAYPGVARPVVSYAETMSLHWNGDRVSVTHQPHAHTDGDSVVRWHEAGVVHMGDTFFNGMYPYIDPHSEGHIDGLVAAADHVLAFADADTRIIPGHGPVAGRDALQRYRDMLAAIAARLHEHLDAGLSDEEILAAEPTADFDEVWGGGFLSPERFLGNALQAMRGAR